MKRAFLALSVAALLAAVSGCGWQAQNLNGGRCAGCTSSDAGGLGLRDRIRAGAQQGTPHVQGDFLTGMQMRREQRRAAEAQGAGGASPTATYPYYTVRGPRDFFVDDPAPIGY